MFLLGDGNDSKLFFFGGCCSCCCCCCCCCCLVTSRFFEHSRPSANLFFGTNQQLLFEDFPLGPAQTLSQFVSTVVFGGYCFFISTPVILSHFQYVQVEHDSPDIDAEVQ